jgi:hypothetical protein
MSNIESTLTLTNPYPSERLVHQVANAIRVWQDKTRKPESDRTLLLDYIGAVAEAETLEKRDALYFSYLTAIGHQPRDAGAFIERVWENYGVDRGIAVLIQLPESPTFGDLDALVRTEIDGLLLAA